ncbi:Hypothetical protein PHPALM_17397 [Phytophthora palmivora]|uniref:Uncharacterized protein n=1 Tax=Phytophthora palmivora TaxID=4796 RepID=A0A2P4XMB9_9STRA|nr:Hypothetical protein PHPALM_17397 [Phytophthora palmivora]
MSFKDFVHNYEMESLQLGITARKDVITRMMEFFPPTEDDGLSSGFQATSQALAARRAVERPTRDEDRPEIVVTFLVLSDSTCATISSENMKKCHASKTLKVSLQELDLGNTDLDASNLIAIAQALRINRNLETLNLDNPVIKTNEEEAIQYIGKMLQVNRVLRNLSLAKHQMTDHGAQVLAERLLDNPMLQRHPTLAEFDLSANRIGDVGAKAFATVLRANMATPLEVLSLCSTSLTDDGVAAIATACLKPQKVDTGCRLRCLFLWGNIFGPKASQLALELCEPGGRFHQYNVETDFLACRVDDEVLVAHQAAYHFPQFASAKR